MIYIAIDTTTLQAQKFVELIETLPFAKVINEPSPAAIKAMQLSESHASSIPEWQKDEVRSSIREIKINPSILVEEEIVFNMLKKS